MADIYLGTTASGLTPLPPIRWVRGSQPSIPIDASKSLDEAVMLDGTRRYNARANSPRTWPLTWEMLTTAEFQTLLALRNLNQGLYFQNNWEDATWWYVTIADFQYTPLLNLGQNGCRWNVQMVLKQAGT